MSISSFSIKQPILITSIVILVIIGGMISIGRLGVDMFPEVDLPFIAVSTVYQGAGPEEIEEQVSKKIESEISTIAGLKTVSSVNSEGFSQVWGEFTLDSDVKYCEQQVRDKVAKIRSELPAGIEEPKIERWDMSKDPIITVALTGDIRDAALYDLADEKIKPMLEKIADVGAVKISGGTRREIQVELDRNRLNEFKIPASYVVERLKESGLNIPAGKHDRGSEEKTVRTVGRFKSIEEIENSVLAFSGDLDNGVLLKSLGTVRDGVEDRTTLAYIYDRDANHSPGIMRDASATQAIFLGVYKQSGTNTVKVVDDVYKNINTINERIRSSPGNLKLVPVHDSANYIRVSVDDVKVSIILAIILAVIIVYLFLGNARSTLITGIAIPNSLLGGFVLMYFMGFTINTMTLLALSLAIGLLVDDAIVVRENIFRKIEEGLPPDKAADIGTREVMMAVVATTLTIIAVFFPIAFLQGIVGRFFKQFGFTVVFIMLVSLFDALTVAPFLSAYFTGKRNPKLRFVPGYFEKFQSVLDRLYSRVMKISLKRPGITIIATVLIFLGSLASLAFVDQTFIPAPDDREFKISIDLPSGTSLEGTREAVHEIEKILTGMSEIERYGILIGDAEGDSSCATFYITLLPERNRKLSNSQVKQNLRRILLKDYESYKPVVAEYSITGEPYPFAINIEGENLDEMEKYSRTLIAELKRFPELTDVQTAFEINKPEYQIALDQKKMARVGITPGMAGMELRYQIAGEKVGKFYDSGYEYDVRVRLKKDQRDIKAGYFSTGIPNVNGMMVPLSAIASLSEKKTPSRIVRENRSRIIQITANVAPGYALSSAVEKYSQLVRNSKKVPDGMSARLIGDNDNMEDMTSSIITAMILSGVFIYLVLASLYKSFITPFTIIVAIFPGLSGAFFALAITGKTLDIFSMIGLVMLMGLVTKNSILLVDYAMKYVQEGMDRKEAIYKAGMHRLRPILMTTFAMLAGTMPVALGIGEAAKGRMSMGIAIIGGILLSTFLTLVVVPAIYSYIDRFRSFVETPFSLGTVLKRYRNNGKAGKR